MPGRPRGAFDTAHRRRDHDPRRRQRPILPPRVAPTRSSSCQFSGELAGDRASPRAIDPRRAGQVRCPGVSGRPRCLRPAGSLPSGRCAGCRFDSRLARRISRKARSCSCAVTRAKKPLLRWPALPRTSEYARDHPASALDRALKFTRAYDSRVVVRGIQAILDGRPGFVVSPWCGDTACEAQIKAETQATLRNIRSTPLAGPTPRVAPPGPLSQVRAAGRRRAWFAKACWPPHPPAPMIAASARASVSARRSGV